VAKPEVPKSTTYWMTESEIMEGIEDKVKELLPENIHVLCLSSIESGQANFGREPEDYLEGKQTSGSSRNGLRMVRVTIGKVNSTRRPNSQMVEL